MVNVITLMVFFIFQMSQRDLTFTNPIWIMFNFTSLVENSFTLPYLPIDMDIFVVSNLSSTENYLTIEEIYQASPEMPLQRNLWGVWSPQAGLHSTSLAKWDRRTDLSGVTLKAFTLSVNISSYIHYSRLTSQNVFPPNCKTLTL